MPNDRSLVIGEGNERPSGGAEAWLVRILVNLCRDRWRRLKVRREAHHQPVWSMGNTADPESVASARSAVQRALNRLRPRTRAIVVMHEIEGQSKAEIAEFLGMSEVTVRWHVATGRSKRASRMRKRMLMSMRSMHPSRVGSKNIQVATY